MQFKEELRDRYGPLPVETRNLVELLGIKLLARDLGMVSLRRKGSEVWARFSPLTPLTPEGQAKIEKSFGREVQSLPLDQRNLVISLKGRGAKSLISLKSILQKLKDVL